MAAESPAGMRDENPLAWFPLIWLLLSLSCATGPVFPQLPVIPSACSAFVLRDNDALYLGKNLDWILGDGYLLVNPAGRQKVAIPGIPNGVQWSWTSRYRSVVFSQLGVDHPLGGMNEAGLVIEELSAPMSEYSPLDGRRALNELQWIQYQLDLHASLDQVVESLEEVRVSPLLFRLHYFVCDLSGDCAVIEFVDGKSAVHRSEGLSVEALTNDLYERALASHRRYLDGTGVTRTLDPANSSDRFLLLAKALNRWDGRERNSSVSFRVAFRLLCRVAQRDTRWSIVYAPRSRTIRYRLGGSKTETGINFSQLEGDPLLVTGLRLAPDPKDGGETHFQPLGRKENREWRYQVFSSYVEEGLLPSDRAVRILRRLDTGS